MHRRVTAMVTAIAVAAGAFVVRLASVPLHGSGAKRDSSPMATDPFNPMAGELNKRGKELRAAFEDAYRNLRASSKWRGNEADATEVVLQYMPTGTSFSEAETVLQAAGFVVSPYPDLNAQKNAPQNRNRSKDWYAVTAWLNPFHSRFPFKFSLGVSLLPRSPGDYTAVESITATFFYASL